MTLRPRPDSTAENPQGDGGAPTVALSDARLASLDSSIMKDVHVELKARLGHAHLSVEELLALRAGSVVKLEAKLADLVELRLNSTVVARGEIVAVGDNFGLRIVDIIRSE